MSDSRACGNCTEGQGALLAQSGVDTLLGVHRVELWDFRLILLARSSNFLREAGNLAFSMTLDDFSNTF